MVFIIDVVVAAVVDVVFSMAVVVVEFIIAVVVAAVVDVVFSIAVVVLVVVVLLACRFRLPFPVVFVFDSFGQTCSYGDRARVSKTQTCRSNLMRKNYLILTWIIAYHCRCYSSFRARIWIHGV